MLLRRISPPECSTECELLTSQYSNQLSHPVIILVVVVLVVVLVVLLLVLVLVDNDVDFYFCHSEMMSCSKRLVAIYSFLQDSFKILARFFQNSFKILSKFSQNSFKILVNLFVLKIPDVSLQDSYRIL